MRNSTNPSRMIVEIDFEDYAAVSSNVLYWHNSPYLFAVDKLVREVLPVLETLLNTTLDLRHNIPQCTVIERNEKKRNI